MSVEPETPMALAPDAATLADAAPRVVETHISLLFLVGDRVYKLKKPVELPFLDWRRRTDREAVCHREVHLNRRLAPDVYLGVIDLVDADGEPCDHLVAMRRMPDDRRLSHLVLTGDDVDGGLTDLARHIAAFHERAERSPEITAAAGRDAVLANWEANLAGLHRDGADIVDPMVVERVGVLARRYLEGRGPLFAERGAAGCAVDGHGDLLADDIYLLDDGPRVLDCLEFSDALRAVDVLDDVAFLAMDLERLGAPDAAVHFLNAYVDACHEPQPHSLAHHYVAYRAGVRAKVACVRAGQGRSTADRADATLTARRDLGIALRHLERARVRLVLVGGLPGTGKTTLATELAARTGWPVLHSDVTRKRLAGVSPETSMAAGFRAGIYTPERTAATYHALLAEAHTLLERGHSVIVDASWTDLVHRNDAETAAAASASDVVALVCTAPAEVVARRLAGRGPGSVSDADERVAAAMAAHQHAWPGAISIDTADAVERSVAASLRAVSAGPGVRRSADVRSR